jgi:hypothetical protein
MSSDGFKNIHNIEMMKNKFDVVDRLLYIAEETLLYKSNETEEDILFMRKVTIRLLKNQKFYLGLVLEC